MVNCLEFRLCSLHTVYCECHSRLFLMLVGVWCVFGFSKLLFLADTMTIPKAASHATQQVSRPSAVEVINHPPPQLVVSTPLRARRATASSQSSLKTLVLIFKIFSEVFVSDLKLTDTFFKWCEWSEKYRKLHLLLCFVCKMWTEPCFFKASLIHTTLLLKGLKRRSFKNAHRNEELLLIFWPTKLCAQTTSDRRTDDRQTER